MINFKPYTTAPFTKQAHDAYISSFDVPGWTLENLGVSEDETLDVYGATLDSNISTKPYILLRSSVHGNEWESTYWTQEIARCLGNPQYVPHLRHFFERLKNKYNFYWIPIHNPSGWESNTRENINGINLNNDLGDQSQAETVILVNKFNELKPVCAIDNHSWDDSRAPCHAMSIYPVNGVEPYDYTLGQGLVYTLIKNCSFIVGENVNEYTSSGHDPTKFRSWSARQVSSSGNYCMTFLIESQRLDPTDVQMKQGFNAELLMLLYFDAWFNQKIQNPENSHVHAG